MATKKEKAVHNFLKRYNDGKSILFEERPLDIIKYPALKIYKIEFKKHKNLYSFYNSEKWVDEFLQNVSYRFHATSKNSLNVHLQ